MTGLLWFHTLARCSMEEMLVALRTGPRFNPNYCTTHVNEDRLGIPRSVYAYLGTTDPSFGWAAFAVPASAVSGLIAPFDTGGLVDHIAPANSWSDEDKQRFVRGHTRSSSELLNQIGRYPTQDPTALQRYLEGARPLLEGPGALRDHPKGEHDAILDAAIWTNEENEWPSWTWEVRCKDVLALEGVELRAWSCEPIWHPRFLELVEADESGDLDELLRNFVPGGPSMLVRQLRQEQLQL